MNEPSDNGIPDLPRRHLLVLAVVFEGGLAAAACGLGWWWGYPPWEVWQLDWAAVGQGVALTVPIFIGFLICVWRPFGPLRRIERIMNAMIRPMFASATIGDLLWISAIAGVGEEFMFRAVLQPALGDWLGLWGGVVAASVLFGLVHPITPTYVVLAAGIGVYLGWAFIATGNIVPCVIAHGLYDFLALLIVTQRNT